jgi:hypothetical protein
VTGLNWNTTYYYRVRSYDAAGSIGQGGPYDAIMTLSSAAPYQFNRPVSASSFDAQRAIEHEVDEAIGLGSASASHRSLPTCNRATTPPLCAV